MAGCFGFKINSLPFELLAKSLPLRIIRKHHHELSHLEAMLFGQAGMLDKSFSDPYPAGLSREYRYLRDKYNLSPVPESLWKFLRLRPSNFPTLRISQFACFLSRTGAGFFDLIDGGSIHDSVVPDDIVASGYWDNHYVFDKPVGASHEKKIGSLCGKLLKINGLAMFLFFYGLEKGQPYRCETALNYLEELGAEENVQISRWKKAGLPAENAMQTQALLHLKQFYCDRKRCLDCRIGDRLLAGDE